MTPSTDAAMTREFNEVLSSLSNLKYLKSTNNRIPVLASSFGAFRSLTSLDLSRNNLVRLPPEIGKLVNLSLLDVSFNSLFQIPKSIERLVNVLFFFYFLLFFLLTFFSFSFVSVFYATIILKNCLHSLIFLPSSDWILATIELVIQCRFGFILPVLTFSVSRLRNLIHEFFSDNLHRTVRKPFKIIVGVRCEL